MAWFSSYSGFIEHTFVHILSTNALNFIDFMATLNYFKKKNILIQKFLELLPIFYFVCWFWVRKLYKYVVMHFYVYHVVILVPTMLSIAESFPWMIMIRCRNNNIFAFPTTSYFVEPYYTLSSACTITSAFPDRIAYMVNTISNNNNNIPLLKLALYHTNSYWAWYTSACAKPTIDGVYTEPQNRFLASKYRFSV